MEGITTKINPLSYMESDKYLNIWQYLFAHILSGFWGRLIAIIFLALSIYFGVRRRSLQLGAIFFVLALCVTYGAPAMKLFGLI